jgi:CubicO group peptidase (beta-lactamase class C family)
MRLFVLFIPFFLFSSLKEDLEAFQKKEGVCGLAVALVYPKQGEIERSIITLGETGHHTHVSIKEDTHFRFGKLTQVFTAELVRKIFQVDQTLQSVLPKGTKIPEKSGSKILLANLLSHASGLSGILPNNLNRKSATQATLLSQISRGRLSGNPGLLLQNIDLDYALLSLALAHSKLRRFPEILQEDVLQEYARLKFDLSLQERQRMAFGHIGTRREVLEGERAFSPFAAATGLYGSIEDLAIWLEKVAQNKKVLPATSTVGEKEVADCFRIDMLLPTLTLRTYLLSDRYLGYSMFLAYVPVTKTGIAILSTSDCNVERIGRELLATISSGNFKP